MSTTAIILNWAGGENNPFSVFTSLLSSKLGEHGISSEIVELNADVVNNVLTICKHKKIKFAFTWQGLGSSLKLDSGECLWESVGVPLICNHGDHPCHALGNHQSTSRAVHHWYISPSFANFAQDWTAGTQLRFVPSPLLFQTPEVRSFDEPYFVFPKNFDDLQVLERQIDSFSNQTLRALLSFAKSEIILQTQKSNQIDHHIIIDIVFNDSNCVKIINSEDRERIKSLKLFAHAFLDKVYRNAISERVLSELREFPLRVYGRGWERLAELYSSHKFFRGPSMGDGDFQFTSRYGIIDVAPSYDSFHDRAARALAMGCGFLAGSEWFRMDKNFLLDRELFFTSDEGVLADRAAAVVRNPHAHRERCEDFRERYETMYPFANFAEDMLRLGC